MSAERTTRLIDVIVLNILTQVKASIPLYIVETRAVLALTGVLEALTVDGVSLIGFVVALRGAAVGISAGCVAFTGAVVAIMGVDEFALTDAVVVVGILMCYWYLSKRIINSFFSISYYYKAAYFNI